MMISLAPLGDLTRFRRSNSKNEVFLITEDVCIKSNGVLLAARSSKIEKVLETNENIPVVEFSDDVAGLEDCLDLIYGGGVEIREDNAKTIYKFGKLFQICEMMEGVLKWIANDMASDKFWTVYLALKNLHEGINKSKFIAAAKRFLITDGDDFLERTSEICHGPDKNTITAVMELLSGIDDIRVLPFMENLVNTETKNNECETLTVATSSADNNNSLQTIISSTVTYIENFLELNSCEFINKLLLIQSIKKVSTVCTNTNTFRRMIMLLTDLDKMMITSLKILNQEKVRQLTSPATSYGTIKSFAEEAGTGIHPCVVMEIVLKWWSVSTDTEHVDMSFIKPLIMAIQNVSHRWYNSVCWDGRYKGLMETLDVPKPKTSRCIYYNMDGYSHDNKRILEDCIRDGDGTSAQLKGLVCSDNMQRYKRIVPAFSYNDAVFPPYGNTKHHWFINTHRHSIFKFVSFIGDSKEEILDHIPAACLHFVPLPGTLH